MKGLLFKELYVMKQNLRMVGLLALVYGAISLLQQDGGFFLSVMSVVIMILPINGFSYDKQAGWDVFAASTPLGREKMVRAKYLFCALFCVFGAVVVNLFAALMALLFQAGSLLENAAVSGLLVMGGLLLFSFMLPLIYRFGVEKSRLMLLLLMLIPIGAAFLLMRTGAPMPEIGAPQLTSYAATAAVAVVLLYYISYLVSCRILARKEL